jgi:SOS response regulatory protein OraA/RecX
MIPLTALTACMENYALSKHVDDAKSKAELGYKLQKPEFNHDAIKDVVDK